MFLRILKAKIHGAKVTQANLRYTGSITIDKDLMDAAGIVNNEAVMVADLNNGRRLTTYAIPGEPGSGVIGINGAAARLISVDDEVLVFSFAYLSPEESAEHQATVLIIDPQTNRIKQTLHR